MTDPSRRPATGDDNGAGPDRGPHPRTPPKAPRWVKVSAIIVGILIALIVVAKLTGLGGEHGPGRHMGAGTASGVTAIAAVAEVQALAGDESVGDADTADAGTADAGDYR